METFRLFSSSTFRHLLVFIVLDPPETLVETRLRRQTDEPIWKPSKLRNMKYSHLKRLAGLCQNRFTSTGTQTRPCWMTQKSAADAEVRSGPERCTAVWHTLAAIDIHIYSFILVSDLFIFFFTRLK